jgi:hypothetical protein
MHPPDLLCQGLALGARQTRVCKPGRLGLDGAITGCGQRSCWQPVLAVLNGRLFRGDGLLSFLAAFLAGLRFLRLVLFRHRRTKS